MAILTAPRRTAQLALILFLVIVRLGAAHAPTYVSAPTGDALSREKLLRGSSPRPTTAPGRPRFGAVELFRREYSDDRTCGLIATEGVYFRCPTGYKCTNIGTVQDCCHKTRGEAACTSQLWTTCFGYSAFISGECDILSPHTLCCFLSDLPECKTWLFSANSAPSVTLTNLACDTVGGTGLLLDDRTITDTSITSATTYPTTTPTTIVDPEPPAPVGAIVGGVVGGVAVIGFLVLAGVLLLRRRVSSNNDGRHGGGNDGSLGPASPVSPGGFSGSSPPWSPHIGDKSVVGGSVSPVTQSPQQMQRPWSPPAPAFNPGGGGQLPMQPQSAFGGGRHQTYQGQQPGGGPTYSPPPQVQQPPMPELGSIQPIGTIENRAELK